MTFDPETLYSRPKPGRRLHPMVFVVSGLTAVAVIGGLATMNKWLPGDDPITAGPPPIRSQNSGHGGAPLTFPDRYEPVVYSPPPAPYEDPAPMAETPAPAPAPAPAPRPAPARAPEGQGRSMLVLDAGSGRGGVSGGSSGNAPSGSGASATGVQQVADARTGREGFYGAAGRGSEALTPTGIVGRLGKCALPPGYFLFVDAVGVISTDTPGQVTAKTSRPIYAGIKGQCYASPPGATLVGAFNANTSYGEERIQLAWTTLILPNGKMVALGGMPGASGDGGAGLQADVNNHLGSLAGAILAGTAVDVIRNLATFGGGDGDDVVISMGGSLADRTASVGERLVDRELSRRPTLTAKEEEMAVQVTRPIELEPYRE